MIRKAVEYSPQPPPRRVVLAAGNGQVGTILARHFHSRGDAVVVLARIAAPTTPWPTVVWDGMNLGDWVGELEGADVLINLAGRNVNCRYNDANRRTIMDSRVETTKLLGQGVAKFAESAAHLDEREHRDNLSSCARPPHG